MLFLCVSEGGGFFGVAGDAWLFIIVFVCVRVSRLRKAQGEWAWVHANRWCERRRFNFFFFLHSLKSNSGDFLRLYNSFTKTEYFRWQTHTLLLKPFHQKSREHFKIWHPLFKMLSIPFLWLSDDHEAMLNLILKTRAIVKITTSSWPGRLFTGIHYEKKIPAASNDQKALKPPFFTANTRNGQNLMPGCAHINWHRQNGLAI